MKGEKKSHSCELQETSHDTKTMKTIMTIMTIKKSHIPNPRTRTQFPVVNQRNNRKGEIKKYTTKEKHVDFVTGEG